MKPFFLYWLLALLFLIPGWGMTQSRKKILKTHFYGQPYQKIIAVYGLPDWIISYPENIQEGEALQYDFIYLSGRHKPPLDSIQITESQIERFEATIEDQFMYDIWNVPYELSLEIRNGIRFIVNTDGTIRRFEKFPDYWAKGSILPNFEEYLAPDDSDQFRTR